MQYKTSKGFEFKRGNSKLPKHTIIYNMGSSEDCPSRTKGLCLVADRCYARAPELMYPGCKPYRDRQRDYWLGNDADSIIKDLCEFLMTKKTKHKGKLVPLYKAVRYFRFNESGDFWSQDCVTKLDKLARALHRLGIKTYGYTARKDLDFSKVFFTVKGSGFFSYGLNGSTRVIQDKTEKQGNEFLCPGSCKRCAFCVHDNGRNVVFVDHA